MTSQDMLIIALLLSIVLYAIIFPGGPGTPRRIKVPIPSSGGPM
jgi:hypothetical protein